MTGFNSPVILSQELADQIMSGVRVTSRSQVAARIAEYVNANGLKSLSNGKTFTLDDTLRSLFPFAPAAVEFRVITGLLASHVTAPRMSNDAQLIAEADAFRSAYFTAQLAAPPKPLLRRRRKLDNRGKHSAAVQLRMRDVGGGLYRPARLSKELQALCGGLEILSRPEVTKLIWIYIKANNLQDKDSRRLIHVDANMHGVCGENVGSTIDCFALSRYITKHLTNV
jgi:chromatin remodeling complex protein RSC6